jgi:hypothetical protein
MNTPADPEAAPRRSLYALLIVIAAAMAVGRIFSAELVYEPSLSQTWPNDPGHPRRGWPATAPRSMPTFSSNDRSRWAAVRALVDEGTWIVGRRDKNLALASAPAALAAANPLQLAVLLEAGYDRRVKSDKGIVFEDGWQTVDKMMNPDTLDYYSTKPPLLTFLVAGEYWLLKKTFGWSLVEDSSGGTHDNRFLVIRVCLLTFNVLPFVVSLCLLAKLVDHFGSTSWGRLFVVATACFGTLVTPFLISLNNHTLATACVVIATYAAVRILSNSEKNWGWLIVSGFFVGFTAAIELPAAAFAAGLGLLFFLRSPLRTLIAFVPTALIPVAALLALNYAELGEFSVGYSKFGGPWYEYEGSHWRPSLDHPQRGIDWAKNQEGKAAYAFHVLLGHHGWFSLTPIYLLGLGGMAVGVGRLRKGCLWSQLAVSTLLLSGVVIGYYIYKSNNYGGWTNGPRWLMWLSPLWFLTMLPIVDRLGEKRWGRALCLALLALSVLSAHYWDWNPWRHPWIYNWMDARGWIPY